MGLAQARPNDVMIFCRSHTPKKLRQKLRRSVSESDLDVVQKSSSHEETASLSYSTTLDGDSPIPPPLNPAEDDDDDDDDEDDSWFSVNDTPVDASEVVLDEKKSITSADKELIAKAIVPNPVDTDVDLRPKAKASAVYR